MVNHLTDVGSSDQHTVKPWFAGKLDFAPTVKDLAAQGFPLVGGRLDYVAGRPAAALVYQRRKHVINAFSWPAASSSPQATITTKGYNVVHWTRGGMAWWLVSDVNRSDLETLARLLREE
jgi:anti-sigma factor RsiW